MSIALSTTNRAQSAIAGFDKVHEGTPHRSSTLRTSRAADEAPEVSRLLETPRPPVRSRTASATESTADGFKVSQAPNSRDRASRGSEMSRAITRAPMADAS